MKPFLALTDAGRFRRLRRLANQAIAKFGLEGARVSALGSWENATWRVRAQAGDYLLRVHRVGYRTEAQIREELDWLRYLGERGLAVAHPASTPTGLDIVQADAPGVPGPRFCTLLTWVPGRIVLRPNYRQLGRVGRLFAELHNAAEVGPTLQHRPRMDDQGWFAPVLPTGVAEVNRALSPDDRVVLESVQPDITALFARLDRSRSAWGPIHADLHFRNVVHSADSASPIDFDDLGVGPYLYDLAIPYMRCSRRSDAPQAWDALISGYRSVRPLADAQLADIRALAVLQMPGVVRYIARRWPDPEVVALLARVLPETQAVVRKWRAGDRWPFVQVDAGQEPNQ